MFDVLETWRAKARDAQGHAFPCGHSPWEEAPDALLTALADFLGDA